MVNEDVTSPPSTQRTVPVETQTDAVPTESATIRLAPLQLNVDEEEQRMAEAQAQEATALQFEADQVVFELDALSCYYGSFRAVRKISLQVPRNRITALIGPSGCGKSTLLRSFNRMNDLIDGAHIDGSIRYHGVDLYADGVDPVEVRRRIGMVFQKPNPFPKSIYDNVAFGPRVAGYRGNMDELVERSLRRAAIWDEVKDKLKQPGTALSGGQQQRLCIARAMLGSRPDRDPEDRGAHARAQGELHDRHRHPQHAAGGASERLHRLPDDG
jgi:ABC-type bacteriocin/lantibiotic exporter with double-glycine peptidase domain